MLGDIYPKGTTEYQRQAVYHLWMALERMRQEHMSDYEVFYWFQYFMSEYLAVNGLTVKIASKRDDE